MTAHKRLNLLVAHEAVKSVVRGFGYRNTANHSKMSTLATADVNYALPSFYSFIRFVFQLFIPFV